MTKVTSLSDLGFVIFAGAVALTAPAIAALSVLG